MSNHAHSGHADHTTPEGHGGYETQDFKGIYAIWAVPFSMAMLVSFVFIVSLWVPAAASKEMRIKDVAGAESSRAPLIEHRAEEADALGNIEQSMDAVVREGSSR